MKIKSFRPKVKLFEKPEKISQEKPLLPKFKTFTNERENISKVKEGGKFDDLKIIPLGGVGDVTKNMYVYEYKDDIVIIDCGIGFPDEAMLGIDLVIPDISYLRDKKDKIKGIVISHGHDDHIGGLPYIWPELEVPIYAQKLASGFIRAKFSEHNLPKDKIKTIGIDTVLDLGAFRISFYRVTHSVPDASGIVLETPSGRIIHQADFKIDWTPVDEQVTDVGKIAIEGDKGVTLLLIDSLRIEKQGYNLSERSIQPTFEKIERETSGKMLITTTSSNISRIQQAINVAAASGRKVALVGRSMDSNFQVARDLGFLQVPQGVVIAPDEIKRFADNKLMIIIAGSQGQPGSSLSRAANNAHKFVFLKPHDSVVFSADPIPSSESAQYALIDKLSKLGVEVYYTALTDSLHVSGHASAEEIKLMINLVKPKFILPIGATYRQMREFSRVNQEMGYSPERILLVEDGQVIKMRPNNVTIDGKVESKNIYVDGLGVGDVGNIVLRDRQVMAEEGIVVVIVPIDAHTSKIVDEPDIISRGFVFEKEAEKLLSEAKKVVESILSDIPEGVLDWRFTRQHIEENLEKFFYEETQRRPMILPVVVEV